MNEIEKRFWSKVNKSSGCWEWLAYIDSDGYGRSSFSGNQKGAHRISWELANGKIPKGLVVDHLCRNRSCVNPRHLEPVTNAENMRRSIPFKIKRTHCKHGHEFNEKNTYIRIDRTHTRECRRCRALTMRRLNAKSKRYNQ